MIDLGISKLALIGIVALVVIGPEKLPRLARMAGALLARAQRYVNDLKAEVNRSMALDELRNMKNTMQQAVQNVEQTVRSQGAELEQSWAELEHGLTTPATDFAVTTPYRPYRRPKKNWRLKQTAVPNWYKARAGVRSKALSGAARVARHRPVHFR